MGFLEGLTLLFVALKLLEVGAVADWSWWWVFAPMWIGYGIAIVLWLIMATVMGIVSLSTGRKTTLSFKKHF